MTLSLPRRDLLAAALALPALARGAAAQGAFPSRPVRLLVGAPPGGAPDVAARLMGDALAARWRQPVVVDNRPAANGNLAAQAAARAEPDGHTLLLAQASILVLNEGLMRNVPFDTDRDFAPVSLLMNTPFLLAARPDLPASNLSELRALAKERGGRMTFATSSPVNLPRFAVEMMKAALGFEMGNVPYSTTSGALQDTMTGRTDLVIDGTPVIAPQVRGGQLKALCVTSPARFPLLEDIPAAAETIPGFSSMGWFGLVGPKAMPAATVERIAADTRAVLEIPEIRGRLLRDFGAETVASPPADFARFLAAERLLYRGLIKEVGASID
ncbi:tripartite tricarboxylate transporter substrate binding protein [Roseomonas nepalensis]|uniref:Tripartite tricarboxylate transporter substrate binding protein n=1 Tax=Muricoccus nepalensis TaxID=1854500 RepID=A0A502EMX1_9PROT|nr:tripartite tricarboxylate transporter substrate binding protein [Roseomonas nepalensis]TPG38362.1 tripartite tricarboxylate transporter substrate binding protein [Roseomonas nepalensis]